MQIEDLMFISLGSNMGDRLGYLLKARHFLSEIYGEAKLASSIYQSDAWGGVTHEDFLNQVYLEMNKVSWPSYNELRGSTYLIIVFFLLFVLFLFGIDWAIQRFMRVLI